MILKINFFDYYFHYLFHLKQANFLLFLLLMQI